jgi:hypothetical protein
MNEKDLDLRNLRYSGNTTWLKPRRKQGSFLPKLAAAGVLGIAAVSAAVLGIKAITDEYQTSSSYIGLEVEGDHGHLLVIDPIPGNPEIPVRSDPTRDDSNIIGWAKPGDIIQAREIWGVSYQGPYGLGQKEAPDGKELGVWFESAQFPVYDKNGEESSRKIVHGVIAGNFARKATEEEAQNFYNSSE